jgi:acyl carrier protein
MKRSELENEVREIIAETLGVEPGDIVSGSNLIEDLGADSLDVMEVIMMFEDKHGVSVADDAEIATFHELVEAMAMAKATREQGHPA